MTSHSAVGVLEESGSRNGTPSRRAALQRQTRIENEEKNLGECDNNIVLYIWTQLIMYCHSKVTSVRPTDKSSLYLYSDLVLTSLNLDRLRRTFYRRLTFPVYYRRL